AALPALVLRGLAGADEVEELVVELAVVLGGQTAGGQSGAAAFGGEGAGPGCVGGERRGHGERHEKHQLIIRPRRPGRQVRRKLSRSWEQSLKKPAPAS